MATWKNSRYMIYTSEIIVEPVFEDTPLLSVLSKAMGFHEWSKIIIIPRFRYLARILFK